MIGNEGGAEGLVLASLADDDTACAAGRPGADRPRAASAGYAPPQATGLGTLECFGRLSGSGTVAIKDLQDPLHGDHDFPD